MKRSEHQGRHLQFIEWEILLQIRSESPVKKEMTQFPLRYFFPLSSDEPTWGKAISRYFSRQCQWCKNTVKFYLASCSVCRTKLCGWAETSRRPVIPAALPGNHRPSGTGWEQSSYTTIGKNVINDTFLLTFTSQSNKAILDGTASIWLHLFSCVLAGERSLIFQNVFILMR